MWTKPRHRKRSYLPEAWQLSQESGGAFICVAQERGWIRRQTAASAYERNPEHCGDRSPGGRFLVPTERLTALVHALGWQPHLRRRSGRAVSRFKGTGILDGTDEELSAAVAGAQKADVVIMALGETQDMSGEAASRAHLGLPGTQQDLLEAVVHTGKPVVLILFSGRPLTLPWAFEHVPAVLAAWFPGSRGGPALVRTLFGDVNPSGKLVVSWPRSVGQEPSLLQRTQTREGRRGCRSDASAF